MEYTYLMEANMEQNQDILTKVEEEEYERARKAMERKRGREQCQEEQKMN